MNTCLSSLRIEKIVLDWHDSNWLLIQECAAIILRYPHLLSSSHCAFFVNSVYPEHECKKRQEYDQQVREIKHGCFFPLVFNTLGGMRPAIQVVYKRLADLIADKPYIVIVWLIRCRLCFSLLWSTIMCLRESRTQKTNFTNLFATDPALAKAWVPHWLQISSENIFFPLINH